MKTRTLFAMIIFVVSFTAAAQEQEINLSASVMRTHFVTAAAPVSGSVDVDTATEARFVFGSAAKDLSIELIGPTGQRIRTGDADTPTAQTAIYPDPADPASTGANYLFVLLNPQAGSWTYRITAPSSQTDTRAVFVSVVSSSLVRSAIIGGGEDVPVDRAARFAIVTADGATLRTDTTIVATLKKPDDASFAAQTVAFHDDGVAPDVAARDGMYSAEVQPGRAGAYQLVATIRGRNSAGQNYERNASATLNVVAVRARFTGTVATRGIDADADTLFNAIVVTPNVDISEAGFYRVTVVLTGSNGKTHGANADVTLPAGISSVDVSFRADNLRRFIGVDGPWVISSARIESLDTRTLLDERSDLGSTNAYTLQQIDRKDVELLSGGIARGLDRTFPANGKFDLLEVRIPFSMVKPGYYYYTGRLYDRTGKQIDLYDGIHFFTSDSPEAVMQFNGRKIGENGVDGPYYVRNLMVYGSGSTLNRSGFFPEAFTATGFRASQFEGYVQRDITPPNLVVSVSPDTLWPADHKMVDITVTLSATDDFDPNPVVKLESITSNEDQNAVGDGNTSPDIIIDAAGHIQLRAERSGAAEGRIYTLTWSAKDESGNIATKSVEVRVPHDQGK